MTLQKYVALGIIALGGYGTVANIVNFQLDHYADSVLSLIICPISMVFAGLSFIFPQKGWKIGQVGLILGVGILTVYVNANQNLADVILGVFFVCAATSLSWAYDFFDRAPVSIMIAACAILWLTFSLLSSSFIQGAAITSGVVACLSMLWYILYDKVRRLKGVAKEAIEIARESIELNKEQQHGRGPDRKQDHET